MMFVRRLVVVIRHLLESRRSWVLLQNLSAKGSEVVLLLRWLLGLRSVMVVVVRALGVRVWLLS
mgnify:CR=1 FL=1